MDRIKAAKEHRMATMLSAQGASDEDAVKMKSLYSKWEDVIGKNVQEGYKFTYGDTLYKVIHPTLIIQEQYIPGQGTESLYAVIDENHAGTADDPIPYSGNMELTGGLYYSQNEVIYLCTRDSGQPLYNALADLVGLYVEIHTG